MAKHALFTVANLVLNLLKFSSLALIFFHLESYSFITSLRAAVTDTSTSQSARLDRSLQLSGFSFRTLKTLRLRYQTTMKCITTRCSMSSWLDIGENGTKGATNLMYWDIAPPVLSTGNWRTSLEPQLLCMLQLRKIVNTQD